MNLNIRNRNLFENSWFYIRDLFEKSWFYILLLIPILQPDYFKEIMALDVIYTIFKVVVFIIVSIEYIKTKDIPRFSLLLILLFIPIYISTIINNMSIFYAVKKTIEIIVLSMIVEIGLYYKGIDFIKKFYGTMYVLVLINFILLLIFPRGLIEANMNSLNYKSYFLSIKNGMISWMVLTYCLGEICNINKKDTRNFKLLIIIISITMILVKSSTGLIGWLGVLFYVIFIKNRKFDKYIKLSNLFVLFIITFLSVVIFNVQEYFSFIFEAIFQKSATFTGRTTLWSQAIEFIKESPLLGYGIREISVIQTDYGRGFSSHNFILELALSGGILTTLLIGIIMIVLIRKTLKFNNNPIVRIISWCIFIFFVCTLTESGIYKFQWYTLFVILYNVNFIINSDEMKREKSYE